MAVDVALGAPRSDLPEPVEHLLPGGRASLWVLDVGLACCAVEVVAALRALPSRHDLARLGITLAGDAHAGDAHVGDAHAHVLLVAGTVTDALAPALLDLHRRLPAPSYVLSFGACSNSGGPYWDSYAVTKGVDQLLPVDVFVPGCPPRPEALIAGLRLLSGRVA